MKKCCTLLVFIMTLIILSGIITFAVDNSKIPHSVIMHAEEMKTNTEGIIESQFNKNNPEAAPFKNSTQGDTYHLGQGWQLSVVYDVDLSKDPQKVVLKDFIKKIDRYLFSVDNSENVPIGLVVADENDGISYGEDAYDFNKACTFLQKLLKDENVDAEIQLIEDIRRAFYVQDSEGVVRIFPIPANDEEMEKYYSIKSLTQLPTLADLYASFQEQKRTAQQSDEQLYGNDPYQALKIYAEGQNLSNSNNHTLVYVSISVCVAVVLCAVLVVWKKRKHSSE